MDGFRVIYHSDPSDLHAPRAVVQVAELLAEQGRELGDSKSLRDAAGQYEFVARAYPAASLAPIALGNALDLLGPGAADDPAEAEKVRLELLGDYPRSAPARALRAGVRTGDAPPARSHSPSPEPSTAFNGAVSSSEPAAATSSAARSPAPVVRVAPADAMAEREPSAPAPARNPERPASTVTRVAGSEDLTHPARPLGPSAVVTGIRHWSTSSYTRVAIDLSDDSEDGVKYQAARVENPDRIYFDLHHTKLASQLEGKIFNVTDDGFLTRIRAARFSDDVTRVVLDVHAVSEYSAFLLPNPSRLIIDIHGKAGNRQDAASAAGPGPEIAAIGRPPSRAAAETGRSAETQPTAETQQSAETQQAASADQPAATSHQAAGTRQAQPGAQPQASGSAASSLPPMPVTDGSAAFGLAPRSGAGSAGAGRAASGAAVAQPVARPRVVVSSRPTVAKPVPNTVTVHTSETGAQFGTEVAAVSEQPGRVEATSGPTSQPIVSKAASSRAADGASGLAGGATESASARDAASTGSAAHYRPRSRRSGAAAGVSNGGATASVNAAPVPAPPPTADGETSMVRALGLKIGRIVIDAGHGGHDSGTLGAGGIEEKDVVLDVALRLGKLLHDRLGAEIVYTRADDTFIPLETRTAIANKAQADLFISVHANSSSDPTARGIEVYYLNFTSDPDAMRVAARENAVSTQSVHELSDLVKQIALKDKIDESRELASDVDASLFAGLTRGNPGLKNRGVKKAPFVVLIGANMPSILAEISFVTNPDDANKLERPEYRERVAEALYAGVARYEAGINGSTPRLRTTEQAQR
jgi:N-acetylmuramoyl-L-alanine amidase